MAHYLVLRNVTIDDGGYYMCIATNRGGTDIKTLHIHVIGMQYLLLQPIQPMLTLILFFRFFKRTILFLVPSGSRGILLLFYFFNF